MIDFEEIDFAVNGTGGKVQPKGRCRVTTTHNYNAVTFSREETSYWSAKGFRFLRVVRKRSTGQLLFLLNKERGLEIRFPKAGQKGNASIHNAALTKFLFGEFSPGGLENSIILSIGGDMSRRPEMATYEVKKK